MKKIIYLILMLICVTGCNKNDSISDITFNNISDCNNKPELLITKEDINIYTYCINDIKVNINNKLIDLKSYIKKNKNAIDNIIEFLPFKTFETETATKYVGERFETDKNGTLSFLKCHTYDGNEDIYIGNVKMEFKNNFCKDNNYTFIRTYYIEEIEYVGYNDYKIILKVNDNDLNEVIINNPKLVYLEEGKTYEFEFMFNDGINNVDDSVKSIFENSSIVEFRETDKDINNQINKKIK